MFRPRGDRGGRVRALRDEAADPFDGVALSIGDLDGDGALDFVVRRAGTPVPAGPTGQTRALGIDRR